MLSVLQNWWINSAEKRRDKLIEKYEQEEAYLDKEIARETIEIDRQTTTSCMQNLIGGVPTSLHSNNSDAQKKSDCFKRTGIITSLNSNHATIDKSILFEINTLSIPGEMRIGSRVEYLGYKDETTEEIKIVKIDLIVEDSWDEGPPSEEKIQEEINGLKNEKPTYFNIVQRNILGVITECKPDSILIDTDYKTMNVRFDSVKIHFSPKAGDRVSICCNVQSDDGFVDKHGEILDQISVDPALIFTQQRCTVDRIFSDLGVLNEKAYFTFDILPSGCKLNEGDIVNADLIECYWGQYEWRCIKLSLIEQAGQPSSKLRSPPDSRSENRAVDVSPNITTVFSSTFQKRELEFSCTNNYDRIFRILSIEFISRRRRGLLRLVDGELANGFDLGPNEKRLLRFEVEPQAYGDFYEQFVIKFENFRVKRCVNIVVCENEKQAEAVRQSLSKADHNGKISYNDRNMSQTSRFYASQIWSKHTECTPGMRMQPKRRFVATRIGSFDVPERLKRAYLTSSCKKDMFENIEYMFPSFKEELNISNYVSRFQTLLYLEEIECFVNFRMYDRERAHFTREKEYLALTIENLSERRPSLVIGDIVKAENPWADGKNAKRMYEGVIHKVLFNRILLKFDANFQQKYNGEDYRLEFYFSRYGYRKQHHAVLRAVKNLGEQFLFPSGAQTRGCPQLDIELDDEENLLLGSSQCKWHNCILNSIQKKAIANILRGEVYNMPYVIFGPPGTGKTVTLVESILQIFKLIPSARLLVGTPSNSSADLITTRLIESDVLKMGEFIRLVSQNQVEKELIPEHLMPYCATADIGIDDTCKDDMIVTESGLKLKCQMKYLGRHRVTIGTCATLGTFLQMGFPPNHFTHVLIDEAGQCTETEIMVAVAQVSKERGQVILAGDPHQLQAVVINRYARERGFSLSFLERILSRAPYLRNVDSFPLTCGFDPRLVTKLLYNYRALPSILNVYNELFYNAELVPMIREENSMEAKMLKQLDDLLPQSSNRPKAHGIFFCGIQSENMQEKDSPSWYNPYEAKNVFLMTIKLYRNNIKAESIGIITPYMKQVKHLRKLFVDADVAMPKIGSVEEFQGQERDIILISTVRSSKEHIPSDVRHALGFIQNEKRINVAISRPRCLLIIYGNPYLLLLDSRWRTIIKYCADNDAYLGCDLPAALSDPSKLAEGTVNNQDN
ncbi:probable RNA helicase armi [Glossina fuscipes]|uniref:RNA helicase n=1 Tax=Glossina fuscipes TaxID=7396 RepID=A0A9C6DY93_9MUSC|nr:probable RNA helicase armi [Glossina fuscipes]